MSRMCMHLLGEGPCWIDALHFGFLSDCRINVEWRGCRDRDTIIVEEKYAFKIFFVTRNHVSASCHIALPYAEIYII